MPASGITASTSAISASNHAHARLLMVHLSRAKSQATCLSAILCG
jgi:hypothetical protein